MAGKPSTRAGSSPAQRQPHAVGKRDAFARIVAEQQDRVAALANRLLGWPDDVEDVVQDVFVAVLRNLPKFRGDCHPATWLHRITVNQCRRQRRKRILRLRAWHSRCEGRLAEGHRADGSVLKREAFARVRAVVRALPGRYREVVVLRYMEELPITDVAESLGLSRNAVDVRLNRARKRLKEELAALVEE